MKKGDKVFVVSNHAIGDWIFVRPMHGEGKPMAVIAHPVTGSETCEYVKNIYPTRRAAVTTRIALLEKTRKSLLTSAENHRLMIAKLKRELRKESQ